MADISGVYRFASSDNAMKYFAQAVFNGALSCEEVKAACTADNEVRCTMKCEGDNFQAAWTYSKTPQYNASFSFKLGEEFSLPAPFPGKMRCVRNGNVFTDTVTHDDGTVVTYKSTMTSTGFCSSVSSSKDGYIGNAYWEKVNTDICGFYLMTSQEGMAKAMEEYGVSVGDAAAMTKWFGLRITECQGVYTMTDFLGNGEQRSLSFRLDEEFEVKDPLTGKDGAHLITKPADGQLVYTMTDKESGKTGVWKASFCEDGCLWTTEKPLTSTFSTIKYRRVSDFLGSWKVVSTVNAAPYFRACGFPEEKIDAAVAERYTMSNTVVGAGVYQWNSNSAFFNEPINYKDGEETSHVVEGVTTREVVCLTKDGWSGAFSNPGGKGTYSFKFGKAFAVMTSQLEGSAIINTVIFARQ